MDGRKEGRNACFKHILQQRNLNMMIVLKNVDNINNNISSSLAIRTIVV